MLPGYILIHIDCLLNIQTVDITTPKKGEEKERNTEYMLRYSHMITQGEVNSSTVQTEDSIMEQNNQIRHARHSHVVIDVEA